MDTYTLLAFLVPVLLVLGLGYMHRQESKSIRNIHDSLKEIERQRRDVKR